MGLISEIASSVGVNVRHSGETELIAAADLIRVLEAVRLRNLYVLGLEGFNILGDELVPDMDAIADFSSILGSASSENTVAEAMRFLSNVKTSDLFYEVTLSEDPK